MVIADVSFILPSCPSIFLSSCPPVVFIPCCSHLKPSMLQQLLRRLVFDVPQLNEYCMMPLKVNLSRHRNTAHGPANLPCKTRGLHNGGSKRHTQCALLLWGLIRYHPQSQTPSWVSMSKSGICQINEVLWFSLVATTNYWLFSRGYGGGGRGMDFVLSCSNWVFRMFSAAKIFEDPVIIHLSTETKMSLF